MIEPVKTLSKYVAVLSATLLLATPAIAQQNIIGGTTGVPEGTAGFEKWMMFRDHVNEQSNNALKVTAMVSGELGSEESILSSLRRGRVQFANLSGLVVGSIVPEAALLQTPFLFDSTEQADHIFDTVLFDIYSGLLAEHRLTLMSWDEVGVHHVYGKKPILTPDDLKGVRFRVSSGLAARLFAEAIASDIIPLSFNENVVGLQTGLVDAGANAVILYAPTGIAEEASHLSLTSHMHAVNFVIADSKWLGRLPQDQQAIVQNGWLPIDQARAMSRAEEQKFLDQAEEIGFTIHTLTPAQRDSWIQASAPVTDQIIEGIGGKAAEIYEAIQEAKRTFNAGR
ncbi:MAG: TRAP transporter substrate-binding protein [Rhodospirillaceae bacterium]|jgi:TRAP-type transport system periplasmic protein|nr:TRAP transporter substrate-binding protein [Rhodospirillaceae bacterium]MBT5242497.1 TRAP transporter substrate-binding protein [Rhodospirillaceae bacterium]MBT6088296.1 TRAP transporter substrate-binding protein [Rhodospirillaceae bacterium]